MSFDTGFFWRWTNFPRHFVPAIVTGALLVVQLLPWTFSATAMMPSLVLISLFFWSVRTPLLCPPIVAFVAGAIADLSQLTPFGAQVIIFTIMVLQLRRKPRISGYAFARLWALFAAVCLGVNALIWVIEIAMGGHLLPFTQVLGRVSLAIAVFPFVVRFVLMPVERLVKESPIG